MALDCSGPIYQQSFFIFDPEDVQQNGGFLYYRIPPTEVKVQNLDGDMIILATRNISALVDPAFWSALVSFLAIVLLISTLFSQCCICCWCYAYRKIEKPLGCKVTFGVLSCLPNLIVIALAAVILWSESTMDAEVELNRSGIVSYLNGTVLSPQIATQIDGIIVQLYYTFQLYRHWISIAFCIVTILIMLSMLFIVAVCAPVFKTATPTVICLGINTVWTILMALMAGVTFFSLFLLSNICYDLYRIGGTTRCSNPNLLEASLSLQSFCSTGVYVPHTIIVGVYIALLVILVIWQLMASFFVASFSGWGGSYENDGSKGDIEMVTMTTTTRTVKYVQTANQGGRPMMIIPAPGYNPATAQAPQQRHIKGQKEEAKQSTEKATEDPTNPPPHYRDSWKD